MNSFLKRISLNRRHAVGLLLGVAASAAVSNASLAADQIKLNAIFLPATRSRFNGIVSMIHDHGHIPMKLLGGRRAVNVTAGLRIVRTSVAHGTAYDIVGTGLADESSLIAATRVAAQLATQRAKS